MLGQQIEIQSSISNQIQSYQTMSLYQSQTNNDNLSIKYPTDNCSVQKQQADQKIIFKNSITTKSKLKKLQQLYQQGLEKLNGIKMEISQQQKQKIQIKNSNEFQLNNDMSITINKNRKGSQTSTAGQDEDIKNKFDEKMTQDNRNQADTIQKLEEKLDQLRKKNLRVNQQEQLKIQSLKNKILQGQKYENSLQKVQKNVNIECTGEYINLINKVSSLKSSKQQLIHGRQTLTSRVNDMKRSILHLSNSTQYLKSTQNCCQQILNQELCSIQYKIQGRQVEYDSNKRYLDKIIRTRKYQQNVSFEDIKSQIQYLNDYCEQMMIKKKNYYGPQIKKYKHKRVCIGQEIKIMREKYLCIEKQKFMIQQKIKQQNKCYDILQDEYCVLLQRVDEKVINKVTGQGRPIVQYNQLSNQQKVMILKQRRQQLQQQLIKIQRDYKFVKSEIQHNEQLVPYNIIRDMRKKIQNKVYNKRQIQLINRQIKQLQIDNIRLNEQKQRIQWRTNPQISRIIRQQKQISQQFYKQKDNIKYMKQQNDLIIDKINKIQQLSSNKLSKQNILSQNLLSHNNKNKQSNIIKSNAVKQSYIINQQVSTQSNNSTKTQFINNQLSSIKSKSNQQHTKIINQSKLIHKQQPLNPKQIQKLNLNIQTIQKTSKQSKHQKYSTNNKSKKNNQNNHNNSNKNQFNQQTKQQLIVDTNQSINKNRTFFGRRENPLDKLKSDFPSNRSQDIPQNLSLLSSNPALYMFLIFIAVVIPGLCIGYNL